MQVLEGASVVMLRGRRPRVGSVEGPCQIRPRCRGPAAPVGYWTAAQRHDVSDLDAELTSFVYQYEQATAAGRCCTNI
jgi:hypothetical protein